MESRSEICAGHGNEFQNIWKMLSAAANEFPNNVWKMMSQWKRRIPKHCLGIHDSVIRPGNTLFDYC
jgi:hypothetical protein